jgi:hypothetical protein
MLYNHVGNFEKFFFNQWVVDSMLLDELKKIILLLQVRDSLLFVLEY